MVFTLPFLLFAAPAGWLADRFPKRRVIVGVRLFEVAAMSIGAYGLYSGNWTLIFIMASLMATQSVVFSPAINGSIPELFPKERVPKANAIMMVAVLSAILIGVAGAGFALGRKQGVWSGGPQGRELVMFIAIAVSVLGFLSSLGVPGFPAASPGKKFPWRGPAHTLQQLYAFRRDRLLFAAIIANVFVYMIGSLEIQVINQLGLKQLHAGEVVTGLMVVAQLVGFGLGGSVSSLLSRGSGWYRAVPSGAVVMALSMGFISAIPLLPPHERMQAFFILFVAAGAGGGLILVASNSFIQVHAATDVRGTVLAAANFAIFGGILVSGPLANTLNKYILPTTSYGIMGAVSLLVAGLFYLFFKRPAS
jgi:acyl-[acyl-carrier-protein]-phospholipid O-acyltransferase/long-chain-fatty-acid--[acyl-carrier-protein] ligase